MKYIISKKIQPGERLPSVRELALQTKVNPNTMQKALVELENLKLIYTERTNGKYVTKDQKLIDKYKEQYAYELANKYLEDWDISRLGYTDQAILRMGIYEIVWTDTPDVTCIDEAVELSKEYSDEKVCKMINGVLDKVYHNKDKND